MSNPAGNYPSSGIPYPGTSPSYYYSGSQHELRKSRPTSGISISPADRRGSMYTANMVPGMDRRESAFTSAMGSTVEHCIDYNAVQPVHKMEESFQRMKIREVSTNGSHCDTMMSGGPNRQNPFSNYVSHRMSRVLRDYREMKQYEEKVWDWQTREVVKERRGSWMDGKHGEQDYPKLDFSTGPVQTSAQFCGDRASLTIADMGDQSDQLVSMRSKRGSDGKMEMRKMGGNFIQRMEWFPRENALDHHTDSFHNVNMKMVQSKMYYRMNNDPILRRGQTFFFAMRLTSTAMMDWNVNPMFVHFMMGEHEQHMEMLYFFIVALD